MINIDYSNRNIFGNIFIRLPKNKYILLNLYTFRRKRISEEELLILIEAQSKILSNKPLNLCELNLIKSLTNEKQILTDELKTAYLKLKESEHQNALANIVYKVNRITISPTFKCNFNCSYCYQNNFDRNFKLNIEGINNICETLRRINNVENYWEGLTEVSINGGEPLQEANIDVINYIIKLFENKNIKMTLLTNGYNILKYKDEIDYSKFDVVQISLDGPDPIVQDINGVNHSVASNVLSGIRYLMSLDCKIGISAILTETLIENFDLFIKTLIDIGIANNQKVQLSIAPAVKFGYSTVDEQIITFERYIELIKVIDTYKLPSNFNVLLPPETRWIIKGLYRPENTRLFGKPCMCSILDNRSIHFAPNGKIYWCLCVKPQNGIIGEFYPNIKLDYIQLNECINRSVFSIEKCRNCDYKFICSSGCPLYSSACDNSYSKEFCGYFATDKFWNYLEKLIIK